MRKIISLLIVFNLVSGFCFAQVYIEPVVGYQFDLNNSKNKFKQINTGLQLSLKTTKVYEVIFLLQKGWSVASVSNDSSFSLNPSLPLYANAEKTIRPSSFSFSVGHRFVIAGKKSNDIFSILLNTGITYQKISVGYNYDKNNYTILNPDQTQKRWAAFISAGVEYMRLLKTGRLFGQINFSSPPTGKKINYPSSFKFMAPLSINAGYSILLKKNKHAKKK